MHNFNFFDNYLYRFVSGAILFNTIRQSLINIVKKCDFWDI